MSVTTNGVTTEPPSRSDIEARQAWMRTLATASPDVVADAWQHWEPKPHVQSIRGPEAGLVMIRARIDSGGAPFNLGEATVTRATVRLHGNPLATDTVGTAYILGTHEAHAHAAACFDALLADHAQRPRVLADLIEPLNRTAAEQDSTRRADARSTLVDFFTVAREHE